MKYMLLLNRMADALPEPGTPELDRINSEYAAEPTRQSVRGKSTDATT